MRAQGYASYACSIGCRLFVQGFWGIGGMLSYLPAKGCAGTFRAVLPQCQWLPFAPRARFRWQTSHAGLSSPLTCRRHSTSFLLKRRYNGNRVGQVQYTMCWLSTYPSSSSCVAGNQVCLACCLLSAYFSPNPVCKRKGSSHHQSARK